MPYLPVPGESDNSRSCRHGWQFLCKPCACVSVRVCVCVCVCVRSSALGRLEKWPAAVICELPGQRLNFLSRFTLHYLFLVPFLLFQSLSTFLLFCPLCVCTVIHPSPSLSSPAHHLCPRLTISPVIYLLYWFPVRSKDSCFVLYLLYENVFFFLSIPSYLKCSCETQW